MPIAVQASRNCACGYAKTGCVEGQGRFTKLVIHRNREAVEEAGCETGVFLVRKVIFPKTGKLPQSRE